MNFTKLIYKLISAAATVCLLAAGIGTTACAERDYAAEREERKTLPIQTNETEGWPEGPAIGAQSAILMEMNTHTILYAKNINEKSYPASTTKILTCLLAMQNCAMDETVTFSHDAIYDVPADGSKFGEVDEGDTMTMEQALYCILVQSANEVASAVGEHVAEKLGLTQDGQKPIDAFTELMNEKAAELGCTGSHFANANGLYDDDHYTTAYDLALIGCEFFNNELLCKMSSTSSYHFRLNPDDDEDKWISSKNQLYKGKAYEYEYLLGSKTGYVSQSRQTLVSAAEKNGMKLVCVIFCEESPYQFEDTVTLFQYGFENFQRVSVNDNETASKVYTGDSTPLVAMEDDSYIILPNTASFSDTASTLTYESQNDETSGNVIATISYTYQDTPVGSCNIIFSAVDRASLDFSFNDPIPGIAEITTGTDNPDEDGTERSDDTGNVIFINIQNVIIGILALAALALIILFIISVINSYSFSPKGQSNRLRRKRKQETRALKREARKNRIIQKRLERKRKKEYKKR